MATTFAQAVRNQENVLEREEIITALTVPPMSAEMKQVFLKSRIRQADEFSLAAVALADVPTLDYPYILRSRQSRAISSAASESDIPLIGTRRSNAASKRLR